MTRTWVVRERRDPLDQRSPFDKRISAITAGQIESTSESGSTFVAELPLVASAAETAS